MSRNLALPLLLGLVLAALAPAHAEAQFLPIFHKLSADDDDIQSGVMGFPPAHPCPDPCQEAHFILRIINCTTADCGTPNPQLTGGVVVDTPPPALPIDCARGVTVSGDGTADAPICDPATNTVMVENISVDPGGTLEIDFWTSVVCDSGTTANTATLDYDQNPFPDDPLDARDPNGGPFGNRQYSIQIGDPQMVSFTKDAPALPIDGMPARRTAPPGTRASWVVEGSNPLCDPITITEAVDMPTPADCLAVDCSTLRLFVDDVPIPVPPGTQCPGPMGQAFALGEFVLDPGASLRIEFDADFNPAIMDQCCNIMNFSTDSTPDVQTSDPGLESMLNPESTCVTFAAVPPVVFDSIKTALDETGREVSSVQPGDIIDWQFELVNNSDEDGMADLTDDFPALAIVDSITMPFPTGTCTITGQTLDCTGVTVPAMSSVTLVVRTTVDCAAAGAGEICNVGQVTSPGGTNPTRCPTCPPSMGGGSETCVEVSSPSFDFATKSVVDADGDGLAAAGETLTWTIDPLNSGNVDAISVVVSDMAPADTSYVPGTLALDGVALTDAADGDAGEVVGGVITVDIGDQGPVTGTGLVTFDTTVDAVTAPEICNGGANIAWSGVGACPDGSFDVPEVCIPTTAAPEVTATKTVSPTGQVETGATLSYSIEVCNAPGAAGATGIFVSDEISALATYVADSMTLDGGALTDAADADAGELVPGPPEVLEIFVDDVAPGECRLVEFQTTVNAGATGFVRNRADVEGDGVPPFQTNRVSNEVTEPNPFALNSTKSVSPTGDVNEGDTLTYTIETCNGPMARTAAGVTLADVIPAGVTYVADSTTLDGAPLTDAMDMDAGFLDPGPPPVVNVTLGDLDAGVCATVVFEVTVDAGFLGTVSNSATIAADGEMPFDTNTVQNDVVDVPPDPPVLSLDKTSDLPGGTPAMVGDTIVYTLTACNDPAAGPASNVVITDVIPLDGATGCGGDYVADSITLDGAAQTDAADGDAGRFEAAPGNGQVVVDVGDLAAGECVVVTFEVTVAAGCDDTETVDNTATLVATDVVEFSSNATSDAVGEVVNPDDPVLLRKEGTAGLVDQCPDPLTMCGCEVGVRLDPVADDCVAGGTCTPLVPMVSWTVPGEQTNGAALVFYEITNAGCIAAGDTDQLQVSKSGADDVVVELVTP